MVAATPSTATTFHERAMRMLTPSSGAGTDVLWYPDGDTGRFGEAT